MKLSEALKKFKNLKKVPEWRDACIEVYKEDKNYSEVKDLRRYLQSNISNDPDYYYDTLRDLYTLTARDKFEDYMIAMEWDRDEKFYMPRRASLSVMTEMLQKLADDEADIVAVSLPPGVGKSGEGLLFTSFMGGREPLKGSLVSSHKNEFLGGAYQEILREIKSPDYRWNAIFPERSVVSTNAKEMKIAVDQWQRFPTFQFGSINEDLAGLARAKSLLYLDDPIGGLEDALSIRALDKKWQKYAVDLVQRKSGNCKELHIATRWSMHDIIGRLIEIHEGDPRFLVLNIPALNEKGESNFDFAVEDGFSKEKYEKIRQTMPDFMWEALYMGQPIEKEGLVYSMDSLRRYINLPEGQPDAVLAVCDTSLGGGDDTALPVIAVYGNDHYLIDAVVTNALPEISDNLVALALARQKVQKCQFESNSAGGRTADKVSEKLKEMGHYCNITKRYTTGNKETKIIVESDWVKEHVLFPDQRLLKPSDMMSKFIVKLCSYSHMGKNPHDDVPDAMAQYAQFYRQQFGAKAELIDRRYFGF